MPSHNKLVQVKELVEGDRIRLDSLGRSEYHDATVYKRETDGDVHVVRPYIHCESPIYIPYMGWEDFRLSANSFVTLLYRLKEQSGT